MTTDDASAVSTSTAPSTKSAAAGNDHPVSRSPVENDPPVSRSPVENDPPVSRSPVEAFISTNEMNDSVEGGSRSASGEHEHLDLPAVPQAPLVKKQRRQRERGENFRAKFLSSAPGAGEGDQPVEGDEHDHGSAPAGSSAGSSTDAPPTDVPIMPASASDHHDPAPASTPPGKDDPSNQDDPSNDFPPAIIKAAGAEEFAHDPAALQALEDIGAFYLNLGRRAMKNLCAWSAVRAAAVTGGGAAFACLVLHFDGSWESMAGPVMGAAVVGLVTPLCKSYFSDHVEDVPCPRISRCPMSSYQRILLFHGEGWSVEQCSMLGPGFPPCVPGFELGLSRSMGGLFRWIVCSFVRRRISVPGLPL